MDQRNQIQTTYNPLNGTFTTFRNARNTNGDIITHVFHSVRTGTRHDSSPAVDGTVNVQRLHGNAISYSTSYSNGNNLNHGTGNNHQENHELDNNDNSSVSNQVDLTHEKVTSRTDEPTTQVTTGGISIAPLATGTMRMNGSRMNRFGRRQLSSSERFKDVLQRSSSIFHMLAESWTTSISNLKVTQICYENQSFAIITSLVSNSDEQTQYLTTRRNKPFGGILWQTSTSPPRAIAITVWKDLYSSHDSNSSEMMKASCSCNPTVQLREPHRCGCEHLNVFLSHTTIYNLFRSVITQYHSATRVGVYFGDPVSQYGNFPTVKLIRTQRPNISNNYRQDWSFYVQFDYDRLQFVPLVHIKSKKIQCMLCRGHRNRRGQCIHELNYERDMTSEGEDIEEFDENTSMYGDENSDEESFDEQQDECTNDISAGENTRDRVETGKYCIKHVKLPLLPCVGITDQTFFLSSKLESLKNGDMLRIEDIFGICRFCKFKRNNTSISQLGS